MRISRPRPHGLSNSLLDRQSVANELHHKLTGFCDLFIVTISKMISQNYTMSARYVQPAHEDAPLIASNPALKYSAPNRSSA